MSKQICVTKQDVKLAFELVGKHGGHLRSYCCPNAVAICRVLGIERAGRQRTTLRLTATPAYEGATERSLDFAFVFDAEGRLVGAYNWQE